MVTTVPYEYNYGVIRKENVHTILKQKRYIEVIQSAYDTFEAIR